ncbi:MAG: DUF167 domain-containing protein [Alphaproteobacteria bacterium]|nr:DUF167 domain-containing protein [Alphaproteobacteria bacterium]
MSEPFTLKDGRTLLRVRVTPRASREGMGGLFTDAQGKTWLNIRLTAPPHDGEANEALLAYLAKKLRVPSREIELQAGAGARFKTLLIARDVTESVRAVSK